jgi:hypothetical protein
MIIIINTYQYHINDACWSKMKLLVEPIFKKIQVIWLDKLAGNICKNKKSAWLSSNVFIATRNRKKIPKLYYLKQELDKF